MISAEQNDVVSTTLQIGLHRLLPELFVHSVPLAFHWQTILTNLALTHWQFTLNQQLLF